VSICVGASSPGQVERNAALRLADPRPELWAQLKAEGLLRPDAPVPATASSGLKRPGFRPGGDAPAVRIPAVARRASRQPGAAGKVSAQSTPFFMASVGKLFTAVAVMQLVSRVKIDLNADVNRYLTRFKIPDTYPGHPITVADLLTHTAGFEDQLYGMYATYGDSLPPLGDFHATHIPERVRPPGVVTSYSNYGYALAGYLVQVVSGLGPASADSAPRAALAGIRPGTPPPSRDTAKPRGAHR
jgi:beta-lactamase family protein